MDVEKTIDKSGIIADVLNPNQHILVQVVKEPISTKGPRLSAELSLAGRFMVLLPFSDRISISQKIEDSNEKERLKRLVQSITPKGFGVIIRTVASNKKVAELDSDLQQLVSRWRNLFNRIRKINKFPSKVLSEINRSSSIGLEHPTVNNNGNTISNNLFITISLFTSHNPNKSKIIQIIMDGVFSFNHSFTEPSSFHSLKEILFPWG